MIKLLALGTVLGVLVVIAGYAIVAIALGLKLDLAAGEPYKLLKKNDKLEIRLYPDRLVVKRLVEPALSERQQAFVAAHWRDDKVYYVIDKNRNIWAVGRGRYPLPTWTEEIVPLRQRLSLSELRSAGEPALLFALAGQYPPQACKYYNTSAVVVKPVVFVSGQIGGAPEQAVEWVIGKNKYYKESVIDEDGFSVYNLTVDNVDDVNHTIKFAAFWTDRQIEYTSDCSVPSGYGYVSIDIDNSTYQFVVDGLGPALAADAVLPSSEGDYTFVWMVEFTVVVNGSEFTVKRVYYTAGASVQEPAESPPRNPIARAVWHAAQYIKRALAGIARMFVNALRAVLPDQLEQLLSDAWRFFETILDVFKRAVTWLPSFADFFKLFGVMTPLIVIAIAIYDPFLVPQFFVSVFDWLRKVVSFIRSLLPI